MAYLFKRNCPICGSSDARTVLTFSRFQFYTDRKASDNKVDIQQNMCRICYTLYLNPGYSKRGFSVLFAEAGQSYGSSEGRPLEQIAWLEARGMTAPGTRFLDAGCYQGDFLALLPESVQKIGVDIDRPALSKATNKRIANAQFIHGDFDTFRISQKVDVITLFHVLEHLPDPVAVLKNLRRSSHGNTRLVVEVPILEQGKTNDVNGFFSVQHMTHFSKRSVHNAFVKAGWRIDEVSPQQDYNGYRIVATPGEAQSTVEGDPQDAVILDDYFATWYKALTVVNEKIARLPGVDSVVIWGGGAHTEFLYQLTTLFSFPNSRKFVIVDGDPLKQGKSWRGIGIHRPQLLQGMDWSRQILLISSYGSQEKIRHECKKYGVPEHKIFTLYDSLRTY